jgi:hypothetical protein
MMDPGDLTYYFVLSAFVVMLFVQFLFRHYGMRDLALPASLCVGMIICAIRLRWKLRDRWWFWATIAAVLILHVPVVLLVPFPHIVVNRVTLLPIGLADCLIILGAVRLVERFLARPSSSGEEAG